jgi:hypothetical protein
MTSFAARVALGLLCVAPLGCSTDHDLLAQKPDHSTPDGGITDGRSDEDAFPASPRDVQTTLDAQDPEPPGPWVLTLLNGVVDVGPVRFCWVPVVDGGEAPTDDPPLPAAPGLSFGERVVLSQLAPNPATTDMHPYLVVHADGANAALSCHDILRSSQEADGAPVDAPLAFSLPIIPAGTLAESRSYLAVANGCAMPAFVPSSDAGDGADAAGGDAEGGGKAAGGVNATACGTGFGPTTLGMSLVRLSRRARFDRLGFQTVNASTATAPAMLLVQNWTTNASIFASDALELGQISPHAQPGYVSRVDFGATIGSAPLTVDPPPGTSFPEYSVTMKAVLAVSHVDEAALTEGSLFTFVLIGAQPRQTADPGAAGFRIELVESAPSASDD